MKAKEYLSRAMTLERRIDARMDQIGRVRALNEKCLRLADMSPGWMGTLRQMSELEDELQADVHAWTAMKREIGGVIEGLEKPVHRQVLEYRYLCGWDWRKIAGRMHYSVDRIWHLHAEALRAVKLPETPQC